MPDTRTVSASSNLSTEPLQQGPSSSADAPDDLAGVHARAYMAEQRKRRGTSFVDASGKSHTFKGVPGQLWLVAWMTHHMMRLHSLLSFFCLRRPKMLFWTCQFCLLFILFTLDGTMNLDLVVWYHSGLLHCKPACLQNTHSSLQPHRPGKLQYCLAGDQSLQSVHGINMPLQEVVHWKEHLATLASCLF